MPLREVGFSYKMEQERRMGMLPFKGDDADLCAMFLFEIKMTAGLSRSRLYKLYRSRQVDPHRIGNAIDYLLSSGMVIRKYPHEIFSVDQIPQEFRGDEFLYYIGEQHALAEANAVQDDSRRIDKGQVTP